MLDGKWFPPIRPPARARDKAEGRQQSSKQRAIEKITHVLLDESKK
jgi:hypothetical protein